MSEGGDAFWINDLDDNLNDIDNVNKYWDDESYVQTAEANHRKVFYHPETVFDHSAVTTSQSGWFISKWANGPLVRHKYDNCPFWDSEVDLTYYKLSNSIISDTVSAALCTNVQRTYSSDIVTTDFTYNWNCTSPLDEVSDDNGNEYIVKGSSQNGEGTVSLTVTTPSGATATASKNVYVGKPDPDDIDVINVGPNYPGTMVLCDDMPNDGKVNWSLAGNILEYSWSVYDDGSNYWQVNQHPKDPFPETPMQDVQFSKPYGSVNGYVNVVIKARNYCGWGVYNAPAMQFSTASCGGMMLTMSPNPSFGETTVSVVPELATESTLKSTSAEAIFDENTEWELEVYSQSQLLKEKKTSLRGNNTTIQTSGWKEGVYIVRVKYKDELLEGKLVVK